jgi:hypothetical protein
VLCSVAGMLVSVWISRSPALAWWGSGLRRYGGLTELALVGVMVTTAILAADRGRFDRCLVAIALGSVGPTVYALFQWAGADPLGPQAAPWPRPGGTFGNPLFLSGYLAAALPVTIACAARRSVRPRRRAAAWGLVGLQSVALAAARSIGPVLGLGLATAIVAAAVLVRRGQRRTAAAIAITIACSAAVIVIVAPPWLRTRTSRINAVQAAEAWNERTFLVRSVLWQAAGAGIQREPRMLAFGSGPESTTAVLTKYSGASLPALEGQYVAPDRAHNETLDTFVTFGAVGVALRLVVLYAALGAALAALGLLPRTSYSRFAALAACISFVLPAAAWWRDGAWTLAMSVPAALVIVASLWVAWSSRFTTTPNRDVILPVAATTIAWLTHYFEIQGGIPSIGSALVGGVAVALTVGVGACGTDGPQAALTGASSHNVGTDDAVSILAGWATAVMLVSLTGAAGAITMAVWIIAALTWGIANLIVGVRSRTMAISAATAVCVALVWLAASTEATSPTAQAGALATRVIVFYTIAAAILVVVAWRLSRGWMRTGTMALGSLPFAIVAVVVAHAAVGVSTADVRLGVARSCERERDVSCAATLYTEGGREDGSDTRPFMRLAGLLIGEADSTGGERRDQLFGQAAAQLALAASADPFDYHQARNRGALERQWARRLPPSDRAVHLDEADRWYAVTAGLAPAAPILWEEWANLALERGRTDEALPRLEQALSLGEPTSDASTLGDAWLRAAGIAPDAPGGLARAVEEFRRRGYPKLAGLYARRAVTSTGIR